MYNLNDSDPKKGRYLLRLNGNSVNVHTGVRNPNPEREVPAYVCLLRYEGLEPSVENLRAIQSARMCGFSEWGILESLRHTEQDGLFVRKDFDASPIEPRESGAVAEMSGK